ncbi:hypothetical protein BVRB_028900, partial [Beta vulgaris subsp. vulgaris]
FRSSPMSTAALSRRIVKETQRLLKEPVPGIVCIPDENNIRYFHIEIDGPADTPYYGGVFRIEMFLPDTCVFFHRYELLFCSLTGVRSNEPS